MWSLAITRLFFTAIQMKAIVSQKLEHKKEQISFTTIWQIKFNFFFQKYSLVEVPSCLSMRNFFS